MLEDKNNHTKLMRALIRFRELRAPVTRRLTQHLKRQSDRWDMPLMMRDGEVGNERPGKHRHRTDGNGAPVSRRRRKPSNSRALCERATVTISDNSQLTES